MGSYQILNLHGHNFAIGVSQIVKDTYETIDGTSKTVLVSGLEVTGTDPLTITNA